MTLNGQWAHFSPALKDTLIPHNLHYSAQFIMIFFKLNFNGILLFQSSADPQLFRRNPPRKSAPDLSSLPHDHAPTDTVSEKILIKTKKIRDRNERQWSGSVGAGRTTDGSPARRPGGETDAQTAASTAPSDGHYQNISNNNF
jgi:hypothetical protein